MSEATYKSKILRRLEKDGWYRISLVQTTKAGDPDTLLLRPTGQPNIVEAMFIEFKAKGKSPNPLQLYRHRELLEKTGVETKIFTEP